MHGFLGHCAATTVICNRAHHPLSENNGADRRGRRGFLVSLSTLHQSLWGLPLTGPIPKITFSWNFRSLPSFNKKKKKERKKNKWHQFEQQLSSLSDTRGLLLFHFLLLTTRVRTHPTSIATAAFDVMAMHSRLKTNKQTNKTSHTHTI